MKNLRIIYYKLHKRKSWDDLSWDKSLIINCPQSGMILATVIYSKLLELILGQHT